MSGGGCAHRDFQESAPHRQPCYSDDGFLRLRLFVHLRGFSLSPESQLRGKEGRDGPYQSHKLLVKDSTARCHGKVPSPAKQLPDHLCFHLAGDPPSPPQGQVIRWTTGPALSDLACACLASHVFTHSGRTSTGWILNVFARLSFSRTSHRRPSRGHVHISGRPCRKPPSPPLPARGVSVGRLFKGVINSHEQGQFRGEANSINWSSTNPEANRANADQELEKDHTPRPPNPGRSASRKSRRIPCSQASLLCGCSVSGKEVSVVSFR